MPITAVDAIQQIKERKYQGVLSGYSDRILLVGVNYDKENKKHHCIMEEYSTEK